MCDDETVSLFFAHIQPYQLLQLTSLVRQCSPLVVTLVQLLEILGV